MNLVALLLRSRCGCTATAASRFHKAAAGSGRLLERDDRDEKPAKPRRLTNEQMQRARVADFVASRQQLTPEEWLAEKSANFSDCAAFEGLVMAHCAKQNNLALGRSLMGFVRSPGFVVLSKYLRLLANHPAADEAELLRVYDAVVSGRRDFLDEFTAADAVLGVCATSRWREALALVDRAGPASALQVAATAFRHGEHELGWDFMERAVAGGRRPALDEGFAAWMKVCEAMAAGAPRRVAMDRMLGFVRRHGVFVSADMARDIRGTFERHLEGGWRGHTATVSSRGVCGACGSRLEGVELSDDEFSRLRDSFMDRVVEGGDVFLKTNPVELREFKDFVQRTAPYTLVMDGLNVAYAMQTRNTSHASLAKQLLTVVQHFTRARDDHKILVLGRQHMLRWPKTYLNAIKQEAALFAVEDLSKDDPYLLYAAMFSGQGTMLLSKDMMRDHLFNLRDPTLASYFQRWLQRHQIELQYIKGNGQVVLKPPLVHNPVAQSNAVHWHVPFEDGLPRLANEVPNTWLCLRKMESRT